LTVTCLVLLGFIYVSTHPLVFMDTHRHCIKAALLEMERYAAEHEGRYPFHPRGYGNAALLTSHRFVLPRGREWSSLRCPLDAGVRRQQGRPTAFDLQVD
jgi:hypothetical protein